MNNQNNEAENTPAPSVEEEGEKVTSGSEANESQEEQGNSERATSGGNSGEMMPTEETKKEEISGYNEHPDQEKVGGG